MGNEKKAELHTETAPPEKPGGIGEGFSNLIGSITTTVKDAASAIAEVAKSSPSVSSRVAMAPPDQETLDARPMTAEEIAEHAAADVRPAATVKRKKRAVAAKKATKRAKTASKKKRRSQESCKKTREESC